MSTNPTTSPSNRPDSTILLDGTLPLIIAASVGGGLFLLIILITAAILLLRRRRERRMTLQSRISDSLVMENRRETGQLPPRIASVNITPTQSRRPSTRQKKRAPDNQMPVIDIRRPAIPTPAATPSVTPPRVSTMESRREMVSPIPSMFSIKSETGSMIANPRPSSELDNTRPFHSFDRPCPKHPPTAFSNPGSRPHTSSRPSTADPNAPIEPTIRLAKRSSKLVRDELLAALVSDVTVAVAERPSSSRSPPETSSSRTYPPRQYYARRI
ncbi:hypothetical protein CPB86DRAFT_320202 [Serendipita vermifera]|nr:hypothetical protein CPB86DRAFT_320202 [Serendipita vermifera]